jgi:hypothetical protein
MSSDARKREKHRLKREKKKRDLRRAQSVSPFRRAAQLPGLLECYVTAGWRGNGLGDFVVIGQLPNGMLTLSGFLVDVWCVGLKDAWGRGQLSRQEFEENVLGPWRDRIGEVARVDVDTVRKFVAGAIRFSHQNGFRLPEHWQRYAAILGDLGPIESADLSDFGIDGGLRYVGDFDFLRKRLIGCTVEQFLNRPDVHYLTSADSYAEYAESDDDEEENEDDFEADPELEASLKDSVFMEQMAEAVKKIGCVIAESARQWCFANNITTAKRLEDAGALFFTNVGMVQGSEEDLTDDEQDRMVWELMQRDINSIPAAKRGDFHAAAEQVFAFYKSFASEEEFAQAIDRASAALPDRFVEAEPATTAAVLPTESASPPEADRGA